MQVEHAPPAPPSHPQSGTSPVVTSGRLGGARADFVAGLGRKVADIRTSLVRVRHAVADAYIRDELRRKLHALASAAKMMKFDAMDRGLAEALGALDRTPRDAALEPASLEAIEQVVEDLPALAWGDGHARSSRAESNDTSVQRFNVLVVGSSVIAEALLDDDTPSAARFTCESTPDTQAAYELVRSTEPDLVVLDADLPAAAELVEALMDDSLTESVPIVVVGSFVEMSETSRYVAMGVAKTVSKPTSREALRAVCEETLVPERRAARSHAMLGDPTLEELGDRLAAEIREAIVGRADPASRLKRIPLGQGTEILGAVWGAIARVREVVTSRSDGSIRFAAGPDGALTPAPLLCEPDVARGDRMRARRGLAAEVRLSGRRVVVADDDPGVVWFLADLLKTAGCQVHEAFDGKEALELAYRTSPDLVISDILMPNLDGFSLCRALRRDVALRDTPVILLSWKEDLLQRVRELGAGAAGYVRKESDTRAIIARVREALRSRGRIEARVREDGEVRGRLDGISIRTLLEIVCATRPEARVSVRDASFLYEVEIRWGAPHRVTRTDGNGSFMKGSQVLAQLLGVSAGRFTVTTSTSDVEAELDGNLASLLAKPIARARAAKSLLAGNGSSQAGTLTPITRIRLDEDELADYLQATPERARLVARRIANGASPTELLTAGGCEPALLDDLLCDLSARGLVIGVEGADGVDLLGPVVRELLPHSDLRASFAPRTSTPEPEVAGPAASACSDDASVPLCTSPEPGEASSLEDAVMREVIHRSPEPTEAHAPQPQLLVDVQSLRLRTSPPPPACEEEYGTPPAEQILALGEATVIDDTIYGSELMFDRRLELKEDEKDAPHEPTPFASVTTETTASPTIPAKRKTWPMVALVAATGVVAWAVLHFSTSPVSLPKQHQHHQEERAPEAPRELPPPKSTDVYYTPVMPDAPVAPGQGVLEVSAPSDAVVLVDGAERSRGPATLKIGSGNHDVRVRRTASSEERGCTIDVHTSRIAHVKF